MTSSTFVILSGTLTFGMPLLLAVLDVVRLSRPAGGGDAPPPPEPPRVPKPLPDCLLPRPAVRRRDRVLEDA